MTTRWARAAAAGALALVLPLGACGGNGGGESKDSGGAATSKAASPDEKGGKQDLPAMVDVETCEVIGGKGEAGGTLTNDGQETTSYTLQVGFYADSDYSKAPVAEGTTTVEDVPPGKSGLWSVSADGVDVDEPVCHTLKLTKKE